MQWHSAGGPLRTFILLSDKTGMDRLRFYRKLIKIAGQHVADLLYIINDFLSNDIFLENWKLARVTPVLKNTKGIDVVSNYFLISVIGPIAKMVEQLVRLHLVNYLGEHSFNMLDQSVYLNSHSVQTILHHVTDNWRENIFLTSLNALILLYKLIIWKSILTKLRWCLM